MLFSSLWFDLPLEGRGSTRNCVVIIHILHARNRKSLLKVNCHGHSGRMYLGRHRPVCPPWTQTSSPVGPGAAECCWGWCRAVKAQEQKISVVRSTVQRIIQHVTRTSNVKFFFSVADIIQTVVYQMSQIYWHRTVTTWAFDGPM